jgi:hypothetical protein
MGGVVRWMAANGGEPMRRIACRAFALQFPSLAGDCQE